MMEDKPEEKSFFIYGRDISKIPCFRNSLLNGIGGGLFMGLTHFMFKSQPLVACNFAVYSFSCITLIYWTHCRYNYSKMKQEMIQMQQAMYHSALKEGTNEDILDV